MAFTIRSPLVLDLQNNRLGVGKTPSQPFDVAGLVSSDSPIQSTATAGSPAVTMVEGALLGLDAGYANFLKADTSTHGIFAKSNVTNSGTNVAFTLDTVNSLTGTTSLLTLATNGTQKWKFSPTTLTFPDGSTMTTAASGGGGGISYVTIEDEGSSVVNATTINFVGAGVTATSGGSGLATVTIPGGGGGSSYWVPTPGGASGDIQYVGGCVSLNCIQDGGSTLPPTIALTQVAGSSVLQSEDTSILIPQVITDPHGTQTCNALLFPIDAWNENYGSTVIYADGTTEIVADPSNFGANYSENIWHGVGTPISSTEAVYGCADDANTGQFSYPIWYKYNFNTKVWTALTSANWNGCSGTCVYDGGNKVFVSGGSYGASSFYHGNVYFHRYRISNNDWDNGGIMTQPSANWPVTGSPSANGDHSGGSSVGGGSQGIYQMLLLPSGKILVIGPKGTTTNLMQLDPSAETWSNKADSTAYTGDPFHAPTMYLMANGTDVLMVDHQTPTGGNTISRRFVIYNSTSDTYTANWTSQITGGSIITGSADQDYGVVLDATWAVFGSSASAMVVKLDDQTVRYANELSGDGDYAYRVSSTRFIMANLEGQHPSHNYIAKVNFSITAGGSGPPTDRFVFSTNSGHTTTVNGQASTSYPEVTAGSLTHKASGSLLQVMNGSNTVADFQTNGLYVFGDTNTGTYDPKALFLQVGPWANTINTSGDNFWNSPNPVKVFSYNLADIASGGNHAIATNVLVDTAPADGSWYEHSGYYTEGHVHAVNDSQPNFMSVDLEIYSHHPSSGHKLGTLGGWFSANHVGSGDIGQIAVIDAESFNQNTGGTTDYQVGVKSVAINSGTGTVSLMRAFEGYADNQANSTVTTIQGAWTQAKNSGGHDITDLVGTGAVALMSAGGNLSGALLAYAGQAIVDTGNGGSINTIQGLNLYVTHKGTGHTGFLCGVCVDSFLQGAGSTDNVIGAQFTAHKASTGTMSGWVYGGTFTATQDTGATGATTSNWLVGLQANAYNNGGTIGNLVGLRVPALGFGSTGTAGPNSFGILIEDQSGANATNKFAFSYGGTGQTFSTFIKADGKMVLGNLDLNNAQLRVSMTDPVLNYSQAIFANMNVTTTPSGVQVGLYAELDYSAGNSSSAMHAIDSEVYMSPTTGTTLSEAAAFYSYLEVDGPGSVTEIAGFKAETNFANAGLCANNYGMKINNQDGVATNNWAVYYTGAGASTQWGIDAKGKPVFSYTDNTGSPGANTANTTSGKCKIAAGQSSVVVTNSNVNANTIIEPIINQSSEDATLVRLRYTCTSGSFTIFGNANATAAVQVSWSIKN